MDFYQVVLLFFGVHVEIRKMLYEFEEVSKRLGEFEEIEISSQSCRGDC
jgi:hypothetical protein